ncbi:sigma-70 family RNA polymerase sigma factor [Odoribacter sp. OttesenSCG-928-L07]|nr:sigma-70 family RNA polymerase sigma factor [Odoribacter sp. OttesenSCG-928-L07]MDL2238719.1 sigma-70 family RNA polymerase sigma factor [Bacteroidales bacterium OttesenSCG-928-L14]
MKENFNLSDNELIANYLKGDMFSMEVLVNRYKGKVYSYILMIVKDSALADDIFQETFIKVIQTLRSGVYKEEGKFIQWINRIAHNLIIDNYRKEKRLGTMGAVDVENIAELNDFMVDSIEDTLIKKQQEQQLLELLELLPEEQKEVVKLRHYCDLSFKDIAALTNVSINTALGRMRYAIINLRKIIEEQNITLLER